MLDRLTMTICLSFGLPICRSSLENERPRSVNEKYLRNQTGERSYEPSDKV